MNNIDKRLDEIFEPARNEANTWIGIKLKGRKQRVWIKTESYADLKESLKALMKDFATEIIGFNVCTCGCNYGDGCLCISDNNLRNIQRQTANDLLNRSSK